jgi:hypothetical protein
LPQTTDWTARGTFKAVGNRIMDYWSTRGYTAKVL